MENAQHPLAALGWRVEDTEPLTIRHLDGSYATGQAAYLALSALLPDDLVLQLGEEARRGMQLAQLALAIKRILALTAAAEERDDYETWKLVYDMVFSEHGSERVGTLMGRLHMRLDYYDPDADYKDDVQAYASALQETLERIQSLESAFAISA